MEVSTVYDHTEYNTMKINIKNGLLSLSVFSCSGDDKHDE